ncbi:MAG: hypothetical protein ABEH59_05540 [Halobacteriales archaeon]
MARRGRSPVGPPPKPFPIWLASLLVQLGSFSLVLGIGIIAVSLAYGSRSLGLGLALVAFGYLAVGLPGWYVVRMPSYHTRLRRLGSRLRQLAR